MLWYHLMRSGTLRCDLWVMAMSSLFMYSCICIYFVYISPLYVLLSKSLCVIVSFPFSFDHWRLHRHRSLHPTHCPTISVSLSLSHSLISSFHDTMHSASPAPGNESIGVEEPSPFSRKFVAFSLDLLFVLFTAT